MESPASVVGRIQAYYDTHFPTGVTPEDVCNHFVRGVGNSSVLSLPFPSSLLRQDVNNATRIFKYVHRDSFMKLLDRINASRCGVEVVGSFGSGKSCLVAAYVVYLHCLHGCGHPNAKRPIYLSSCALAGPQIILEVVQAFKIAFPEVVAIQNVDCTASVESMKTDIHKVLHQGLPAPAVFIYDDFSFLLGKHAGNGVVPASVCQELGTWLRQLTRGCSQTIEVASTSYNWNPVYISFAEKRLETFRMPACLSEPEWKTWQATNITPLFNNAEGEQAENVRYWTGHVPQFLVMLNSYGALNIKDALLAYYDDCDHTLGGQKVIARMNEFIQNLQPSEYREFVRTFSDAVVERTQHPFAMSEIDPRFFSRVNFDTVKPICGIVASFALKLLYDHPELKQLFYEKAGTWSFSTKQSRQCPINKSLTRELCFIRRFIRDNKLNYDQIVRYVGDHPPCESIKMDRTLTLYWSYHLMQGANRPTFVTRKVIHQRAGKTRSTSKRQCVDIVEIDAYQVVESVPADGSDYFAFYTQHRSASSTQSHQDSDPPYLRFEAAGVTPGEIRVVHRFHWVVENRRWGGDSIFQVKLPSAPRLVNRLREIEQIVDVLFD